MTHYVARSAYSLALYVLEMHLKMLVTARAEPVGPRQLCAAPAVKRVRTFDVILSPNPAVDRHRLQPSG